MKKEQNLINSKIEVIIKELSRFEHSQKREKLNKKRNWRNNSKQPKILSNNWKKRSQKLERNITQNIEDNIILFIRVIIILYSNNLSLSFNCSVFQVISGPWLSPSISFLSDVWLSFSGVILAFTSTAFVIWGRISMVTRSVLIVLLIIMTLLRTFNFTGWGWL